MGILSWLGLRADESRVERRSITSVPWGDGVPFNQIGSLTAQVTQQRALSLGPVYAANRVLADTISTLPLKAYRKIGDDRIPMASLPPLFANLESDGRLVPWLYQCVTSLGLRGNAYGLVISRDGYGYPTAVDWLDPSLVAPDERPGETGWLVNGRAVSRDDIVHIPWFSLPGSRVGLSPMGAFAATLGVGLGAQSYAANWFDSGGFPPGTFRNTQQTITQEQAQVIKARTTAAIRSREVLTFGSDWEYNAISVPPEEAQFVETMKMTANQIAPIYGVPPEDIGGTSGDSMTYANVEQKAIDKTTFGFRPWCVRFESKFASLLPDRQYVRFNLDALVRADLKSRWEVNKIRVDMGAASLDEIRVQEDQAPLPNGQGQQYGPKQLPAPAGKQDEATVTPIRSVR